MTGEIHKNVEYCGTAVLLTSGYSSREARPSYAFICGTYGHSEAISVLIKMVASGPLYQSAVLW